MSKRKKVIIIGGGISGLAAAFRLSELSRYAHTPVEIVLVEAKPRLGGVIESRTQNGFLLEGGPDSFISEKPAACELAKRLGISGDILGTNEKFRRSFIYKKGKLVPVPEGFYLIAPSQIKTFLATPLLDWSTKLRMGCELFISRRDSSADESVASFVRRRFGETTLREIAQPMIGGIYTADPEYLSLATTMPQFHELERRYGSVIKGLLARKALRARNSSAEASGPRYSLFLSFQEGMETLIRNLSARLVKVKIMLSSPVTRIQYRNVWEVGLESGTSLNADAVGIALPAYQTGRLLLPVSSGLAQDLSSIPYESVATINLAYPRSDIPHRLDGFGFVVPAYTGRKIVACSFSSVKFAGRAPADMVLLRAFVGGALHREVYESDDETMLKIVRDELRHYLGIEKAPRFSSIRRYPHAMPQYRVGHLDLVRSIQSKATAFPGLYLAGNAFRGIGVPDCVKQAESAAEAMFEYLKGNTAKPVRQTALPEIQR
ncbi:MAG: protoporphyrinogen oxidase [Candidatus Omnitrophica bacterium]|nr:protoporphyrinogen oxidase [Candidatus Omnitrophota bacterium]MDD5671181.1 protoporphyrinogen oxidase [Candidatus Omnitrophota bacterium]